MTKDHLGNIHAFLLMDLDGDSITTVTDADQIPLDIDHHFDGIHLRISLLVVSRVHQNLVEDLVQARDVGDGAIDHLLVLVHPESLRVLLDGSDVGIGTEQDVLELRFLLVHLLDRLPAARSRLRLRDIDVVAGLQGEFGSHGVG